MKLPLYQVDAFTSRLFGGNPAAVVVMNDWLHDDLLQAIAAENNLAETAFVIPKPDVCPLRWFTPTLEVDLCGHATLATAHVLFRYYFPSLQRITFSTKSGNLPVARDGEVLAMDFPSRPGGPIELTDALIAALGARPREAFLSRDLLAVFDSEAEIRAFRPDFERIASLDAFALIISAPGTGVDFVSRFFAPRAGIPEDPATGSSHCMLVPYWAVRLGKPRLVANQLSARGGELHCELRGERVIIGGTSVEYLRGEITAEPRGLAS
ncbi:MAG: PhzF family phenazine biosynthesis protein [Nitrospinae bacterium]|nr:PhzF family phenazine biosynthesis protein [Nitrospinota bacterium]